MKKKILSIFIFVLVVAISLTILTGCPKGDGSKELRIGFAKVNGREGLLRCAAYGDTDIFEIDNVTLDFYFGQYGMASGDLNYKGSEIVSSVFLLSDAKSYPKEDKRYEDYKNVTGVYIMKEIAIKELSSSKYVVDGSIFKEDGYSHHEKFAIPQEVFLGDRTGFYFAILLVAYDAEQESYFFTNGGGGITHANAIDYEKLENNKIKLSDGGRYYL